MRDRGKKKYKSIGPWKPAAEAFKRDIEEELSYRRAGRESPTKEIPLKDAIDKYLEYSKVNKSERTYLLDRYVLGKVFFPFLQDRKIHDVKAIYSELLDEFKTHRLATVEKITHNREITCIKAFFSTLVKWNYLRDNPASELKKLRLPVNLPRFCHEGKAARNAQDLKHKLSQ